MAAILNILKYCKHLQFDLKYKSNVPNYANKVIFNMMMSSMTTQGGPKVALYIYV